MILDLEQKYRSILEDIEELYYEVDLAGNLTFFNDSMSRILGYTKDELIGMNNRQYMDEETSQKVYQMFNQVYRTGVPAKGFDWELIGKDGTRRILETSFSLMPDSEGRPIGFYGIGRDITERKRTENGLRESEKRYRALFEGSSDAIYVTTQEGEIVDANQSMLDLFGYGREEMMGLNVRRTYVYPEERRKFRQQIEREGFVRDYEIKLCKKDGTEMECLLTATVRRADDGGILGYQGIIRDVTEYQQMLNELHIEKQRLQTLSENAPFGMVMIDHDGTFRYINPKFKELFGYDLSDVPDGKTWFRKAYPDSLYRHDVVSVWKEDLKSIKPGEKRSRVFTVTCKDGTEKIINFIPVQLETDENLMACEDITEREQAEAALRQSEEKYRTILNSIEEGYYEVDLTGNFSFFNDFLVKSLGYTREELKGLNNRQYMSPETAKLVFNTFNEVYRTGNPKKDFEWELINKDGTKRFVEVSISLMRDRKGQPKGFYGTARDITERKRVEEQEGNLRRARDKILNHLSHELRTPLSLIQVIIRILKRKAQAQAPPLVREEIFDMLEKNVGRLSDIQRETDKIIRSYLEMEKGPHLEAGIERLSPYSFAQKVLGKVKEKAGHRDIQITLAGPKDLTLNANPRVLEGMFMGLLKNAIENTPDEGMIRIILEQKAQRIQLKFMDFGIGVTKENQRRLFDGLFHTLDTELYRSKKPFDFGAGGKGLDLLRMKVYSQRFGFDISVTSQRCRYLPTDSDLCPGRISQCPHCGTRDDCFNSGGSTFTLTFTVGGGIEVK
jgi:PAS domain S-box-containing protein